MGEGCPFAEGFGGAVGEVVFAWFVRCVFGYAVAGFGGEGADLIENGGLRDGVECRADVEFGEVKR